MFENIFAITEACDCANDVRTYAEAINRKLSSLGSMNIPSRDISDSLHSFSSDALNTSHNMSGIYDVLYQMREIMLEDNNIDGILADKLLDAIKNNKDITKDQELVALLKREIMSDPTSVLGIDISILKQLYTDSEITQLYSRAKSSSEFDLSDIITNETLLDLIKNSKDGKIEITYDLAEELGIEPGYLYFPKDYDGSESLALTMYFGGDECSKYGNGELKNHGIGLLFNSDSTVSDNVEIPSNLIVYCPNMNSSKTEACYEAAHASVEKLVSYASVDTDKISAVGFSLGGEGVTYLSYSHPNYYSAIVNVEGSLDQGNYYYISDTDKGNHYSKLLANTDTQYIFIQAQGYNENDSTAKLPTTVNVIESVIDKNDSGHYTEYRIINSYGINHENGSIADIAYNSDLLSDLATISKSDTQSGKYDGNTNYAVYVTPNEVSTSTEGWTNVTGVSTLDTKSSLTSYYQPISSRNNTQKQYDNALVELNATQSDFEESLKV